jgi:hypothetical protein
MSGGFVSRWAVARRHRVTADDLAAGAAVSEAAVERWIADACAVYVEGCAALTGTGLRISVRAGRRPAAAALGSPREVVALASAKELLPSSFTLGVRLRAVGGGDDDRMVDTTNVVTLEDPATGETHDLGDEVRAELIAIERSAARVG